METLTGFSKVCCLDGLNTLLSQEAVSWKLPHRGNGRQNEHSKNRARGVEALRAQIQHTGQTVVTSSRWLPPTPPNTGFHTVLEAMIENANGCIYPRMVKRHLFCSVFSLLNLNTR